MAKTKAILRAHTKKRLLQRYELDLNRSQIKSLIKQIQQNEARFIERTSNNITIWSVRYKTKEIKVVYDKRRKEIVTALPPDYVSNEEFHRHAKGYINRPNGLR